jgi:lipid-binding SYLF domain-containing protein
MNAHRRAFLALPLALSLTMAADAAQAATAAEIDARVRIAVDALMSRVPGGPELWAQAKGALVLPDIMRGGFIVGGAYGEGALLIGGETVGYYSIAAASIGLQAGAQRSTQVLLFMTDAALARFRASDGWRVGADATVTVLDQGVTTGVDTISQAAPVIAIVFGQDGLMAGASVEGGKISPIRR